MRLRLIRKLRIRIAAVAALLCLDFQCIPCPSHGVSTVTLYGSATSHIALTAGAPSNAAFSGGTGAGGTYSVSSVDTQNSVDTYNFGTLSAGDGTNEIATVPLRVRGNTKVHISWMITSYSASHVSYGGTALTGSSASSSQLSFITLGTKPMTEGSRGDLIGATYQASFLAGKTINQANGGVIAPVVTTADEKLASFTRKPSRSGNLTNPNNWVEVYPTFSVPTGLQWQPTGSSPNWSIVVSFILGTGA